MESSTTSSSLSQTSIIDDHSDQRSEQRPTVLKHKQMLKLWPSAPQDQTTPKARQLDRNPFDDPKLTIANNNAAFPSSVVPAPLIQQSQSPNHLPPAPRTPTGSAFQQHRLLHPSSSSSSFSNPTTPLAPGVTPPTMQSFMSADVTTPGSTVLPTTQLSIHPPVFSMQQPPAPRTESLKHSTKSTPSGSSTTSRESSGSGESVNAGQGVVASGSTQGHTSFSRGQLHLKIISASNLSVPSHRSRPYVVVQYDNNEFVSRDPILETEKEARGSPAPSRNNLGPGVLSRNSSSTALATLNALNINGKKTPKQPNGSNTSPSSSVGSYNSNQGKLADPTTHNNLNSHATIREETIGFKPNAATSLFGGISPSNPVWKHHVTFDVTSDSSVILLNVYDRFVDETSSTSGFLGMLEIRPTLIDDHSVDNWYQLRPHGNEKITGSIRVQTTYEQYKTRRSLTPRDFEFLKLIGRGTFGRVFQVRKKDSKRIYAMKVLSKREIVAKKEVAHTIGEKKILQKSLTSPFLVGLKFSFQTETDLYLVTDFKSGGELFWHLQRDMRFPEDRARFYIAELILALEHLHKYDIVYRDLKPENILLDATGHIALCDFGLSKADLPSDQLTNTFCGTTEYLAPEVLLDDQGYSKLVDFWSLGVLLFEMCCGWSPFYDEDTQQMYKNICFGKIKFPRNVINEDGKHFVKGLLNRNPKHRLGSQRDTQELKEHPFFKAIDWNALALKQVTPPFIPDVESDESVAHFDPEFTGMSLEDLGVLDDSDFDDDDPSGAWVESASLSSSLHTPNGPLGSDLGFTSISGSGAVNGITTAPGSGSGKANGSGSGTRTPVESKPKKRRPPKPREHPLSSSVQENFRGFSYFGESLGSNMLAASAQRDLRAEAQVQAELEEQFGDGMNMNPNRRRIHRTGEDEFEDDTRVAGRYGRDVDME